MHQNEINHVMKEEGRRHAYFNSFSNRYLNPLTHMSDQDRIFPYNINTNSTTLAMRIEKNDNLEKIVDPIQNSLN